MNIIASNNISNINNSIMSTLTEYKDKYIVLSESTKNTKDMEEEAIYKTLEVIPITDELLKKIEKQHSTFIVVRWILPNNTPFDTDLYRQLHVLEAEINDIQDCLSSSNSSFEEKDINTLCEQVGQDTCTTSTESYCNTSGLGLEPSNFDKVLDGNVYGTCTNWYEACSNQFAYCDNSTVCDPSFGRAMRCGSGEGCGHCESSCQDKCQHACQSTCEISCEAKCQSLCQSYCQTEDQSCRSACESSCQSSCQLYCQEACEQYCQTSCYSSCNANCVGGCQTTCQYGCQTACDKVCQVSCYSSCNATCANLCNNCQILCEAACQSNCQISCLSACQTSCQNNCETSCQSLDQNNCTMASESGCISISDSIETCQGCDGGAL